MPRFYRPDELKDSFEDFNKRNNHIIASASIANAFNQMNNPYSDPKQTLVYESYSIHSYGNDLTMELNNAKAEELKNKNMIKMISSSQKDSYEKGLIRIAEKLKTLNYDAIMIPFRGAYPLFKPVAAMCGIPDEKIIPIAFTDKQKKYLVLDPIIETISKTEINLTVLDTGIGGAGLNNLINNFIDYSSYNDRIIIRLDILYMFPKGRNPDSLKWAGQTKGNLSIRIHPFIVESILYEDFFPALGLQQVIDGQTVIYKENEAKGKLIIINHNQITYYESSNPHIFDQITVDGINAKLFGEENYHVYVSTSGNK